MLSRTLFLSLLSIISLALVVEALENHVQRGRNHRHHELAAVEAVHRRRRACSSKVAVDCVTRSSPLASSASAPGKATISSRPSLASTSRLVTSVGPAATASSTVAVSSSPTHVGPSHGKSATSVALAPVAETPAVEPAVVEVEPSTRDATSSAFTPNSMKAGIAGGDAYNYVKDHIGWWYDWSPTPSKPGKPIPVPMLWGGGTVDATDAARLAAFKKLSKVPVYVLGFEEPDCAPGSGSAGMTVAEGVAKWEKYIAPLKAKGAKLGSPSMCKQADETWLAEFAKRIKTPWDFTAIHINKNSLDGVKKDIDHYAKYGKPIWVTEFACVADNPSFVPCTDQAQINKFIQDTVSYFESNSKVYAYAFSNGLGLGNVWPMTTKDGKLSASGQAYLKAISKYH